MRGKVLHYDEEHGFGFITGDDGNRYTFRREDLRRSFPLSRDMAVEFRESGGEARDVSLPATQPAPAAAEARTRVALTATPIAGPAARPEPRRYGRNAIDNGVADEKTGLWDYFRAAVTVNYANFRGRARRKEYWGFALFYTLGVILLSVAGAAIDAALGNFDSGSEIPVATIAFVLVVFLAGMVPGIAIGVRRFHDIGLSGWFYLAMWVIGLLLAGGGTILAIVLGFIPSQRRENKWGPVPAGAPVPPAG